VPLESLFTLASAAATGGWVMLAASLFVPRARATLAFIGGRAVPAAIALGYAVALGIGWADGRAVGGGFGSLAEVEKLFSVPSLLLAGWVHYLAFDLLVGRWEIDDAAVQGLAAWWLLPCLALTFLAGPIGFLLYLVLRAALRPRAAVAPASGAG
jgi:hypothetical protein